MTMTRSPTVDIIYVGTALNLTCFAVLAAEVDTAVIASSWWTGPDGQQLADTYRVTILPVASIGGREYRSIAMFAAVDDTDNGNYECQITFAPTSADSVLIQEECGSVNINISISGVHHISMCI